MAKGQFCRAMWCAIVLISALVDPDLAHADCDPTSVQFLSPGTLIGPTAAFNWTIASSCPFVETGLLFGIDPVAIASVGTPIYGPRPEYRQELTFADEGVYWIAAYAIDESGNLIQSPPQLMYVVLPLYSLEPTATSVNAAIEAAADPLAALSGTVGLPSFDLSVRAFAVPVNTVTETN